MASQQKFLLSVGVLFGAGLIGWALLAPKTTSQASDAQAVASDAIHEENGVQVIHITAGGGYSPSRISAQAGKPSRLDIETNNTYDCSSAVRIPALNYTSFLPHTGTTSIDVPAQDKGSTLTGLCSMGMYRFEVTFN